MLSPINVVVHFCAGSGMGRAILSNTNPDIAQILLMVKPGMMTDASPCHMPASMTVSAALLVLVVLE